MSGERTMLAECKEVFKRLEAQTKAVINHVDESSKHTDNKLDGVIKRLDRVNGRYEKHLDESVDYRRAVDEHEILLKQIKEEKHNTTKQSQWRIGIIVATGAILAQIIIGVFF